MKTRIYSTLPAPSEQCNFEGFNSEKVERKSI
jgi:hypothetical protein